MLIEIISAFFAAYAFGILFNIKGKYLTIAGIGGGLGWFLYKVSLQLGVAEATSLFIASVGFSVYCETCARIYKTPSTILSVCCLIPLVPGYGVYNTLYAFLKGEINFLDIEKTIFDCIEKIENIKNPTIEEIFEIDKKIRKDYS